MKELHSIALVYFEDFQMRDGAKGIQGLMQTSYLIISFMLLFYLLFFFNSSFTRTHTKI